MNFLRKSIAVLGLATLGTLVGCQTDKPEHYRNERPPVTDLEPGDRGLQSSEVVEASDLLVQKILSLPEVNHSPRRLTVVFTGLEDFTRRRHFNYDIFLERLKTNISEQGRDRIAIVSNKDKYFGIRNRELDPTRAERDDFAQNDPARNGGIGNPPANRVQPDFALTGKVMDMPNRETNYYLFTFTLADIRSDGGGTEIPMRYEVKVRR